MFGYKLVCDGECWDDVAACAPARYQHAQTWRTQMGI
jgi:hypothetical protein